ncbi:hypothetical protein V8F06_002498 [Rhypophila decipiens]
MPSQSLPSFWLTLQFFSPTVSNIDGGCVITMPQDKVTKSAVQALVDGTAGLSSKATIQEREGYIDVYLADEDLPRQNLEPPVQQVSEQAKPPYMFRLPDELIVRVLNQLGGNDRIVSLLILRRVSQRLRRIVYEASIWRGIERDQGRQPFTEFPGECRFLVDGDISSI